jgi:hypothetical protein
MVTLLICGAVAAIGRSEPKASYNEPGLSFPQRVIRMMHDRNLNKNATDAEIAGYYEGLLAGKPATLLGRSRDSDGYLQRGDYLYYESRPHLDRIDYDDPALRFVTNSHGMPDVEYSLERRPNVRRLAVLGDSVTRGQGAPFGESFEALTEQYLNEHRAVDGVEGYELLNFSNTGYRLTQIVDVALEKAPAFAPDVYVVCLSRLAVSRKWGDHVAQLVYAGVDVKYPYLKALVKTAGLDARDAPGTMDAKLAPYRLEAIRWAMETIREKATADGAEVVVMLVPTATAPDDLERAFDGVEGVLRELGVPTISLLDTFADVDLTPFMVGEGNIHPNRAGHHRIFQQLKSRLDADDAAARILLGRDE